MKRFLAAGFALFLLLLLPACRGGSPESTSYGADGELTQAEVRGHYEILFQAAGEEAFGYVTSAPRKKANGTCKR